MMTSKKKPAYKKAASMKKEPTLKRAIERPAAKRKSVALFADPEPTPRIAKILIRGFRAFPGNEDYEFNLTKKGKNLLLYGENGSGKSSLFKALCLLLQRNVPAEAFDMHKNVFWQDPGVIRIELTAGTPADYEWSLTSPHPATDDGSSFQQFVRRSTLLGYRDLLRTSMDHEERSNIDLYPLITQVLLGGFELPDGVLLCDACSKQKQEQQVAGLPTAAKAKALGLDAGDDEWEEIEAAFQERLGSDIASNFGVIKDLLSRPDGLVAQANDLLSKLDPGLSVSFAMQEWEAKIRGPVNATRRLGLCLECQYHGYDIEHPARFLNEARLTAIALSLYLAAARLCTPGGPDQPRLLVLDDVLIGLDMSHRLPVLKLLQEKFKDWQVFLLTHDRVWYDLARLNISEADWANYKLFELEAEDDMPCRPVKRAGLSYLEQAEAHLAGGYYTEAAVNARAAFEEVLRDSAEVRKVKLEYKQDPTKVTTDELWTALKNEYGHGKPKAAMDQALEKDVESMRSKILNELSHSAPRNLGKVEAQFAIHVVRWLKAALEKK